VFQPQPSLALRLVQWFLPWLCVFGLSSTLAFAADVGLVHSFSNLPAVAHAETEHWIEITVSYDTGPPTFLRCLAIPGITTTERMALHAPDLDLVAAQLCSRLEIVVP